MLKLEGVLSMGAILKRSKRLLVLQDPSYARRLWCVSRLSVVPCSPLHFRVPVFPLKTTKKGTLIIIKGTLGNLGI